MNIGQYVAASWALPLLEQVAKEPGTHPTFLLNSSGIAYSPLGGLFSLSMQKAAQNNFLLSMSQTAGPKRVHVARVDINGQVTPEDPEMNPKNIASKLWDLYSQDKNDWVEKVDVGTMDAFLKKLQNGQ
jgi:hypothetical protein